MCLRLSAMQSRGLVALRDLRQHARLWRSIECQALQGATLTCCYETFRAKLHMQLCMVYALDRQGCKGSIYVIQISEGLYRFCTSFHKQSKGIIVASGGCMINMMRRSGYEIQTHKTFYWILRSY